MTLTKKVVATVALIIGATAAAASPALANNAMPVSSENGQTTVVTPQDNHMP